MEIAECCKQSMTSYDYADDPGLLVETQRRTPIGQEIIFFDCTVCGTHWKRLVETFEGGALVWVKLQPSS